MLFIFCNSVVNYPSNSIIPLDVQYASLHVSISTVSSELLTLGHSETCTSSDGVLLILLVLFEARYVLYFKKDLPVRFGNADVLGYKALLCLNVLIENPFPYLLFRSLLPFQIVLCHQRLPNTLCHHDMQLDSW